MPEYLQVDTFEYRFQPRGPKREVVVDQDADAPIEQEYAGVHSVEDLLWRAYQNRSGRAYDRVRGLRVQVE